MKKLIILLGVLSLSLCVACNKKKQEVNHVSFSLNGKTIELDSSMQGEEVYETLFLGQKNFIFRTNPYKSYHFENHFENNVNQENVLTIDYELKNYNLNKGNWNYESYEHMIEEKNKEISSSTPSKNIDETLRFYGKHSILNPEDEGYTSGELDVHYVDDVYYTQTKNAKKTNKSYRKCYNRVQDFMHGEDIYLTMSDVTEIINKSKLPFEFGMFLLSSEYNSFVHYGYSFTEEEIILNYKVDFSVPNLYMLINEINESLVPEDVIEFLKEDKKRGSFYSASISLNYKDILVSEDGQEHLDHPENIYIEDVRVNQSQEALKTILKYQVLDLDQKELIKIKKDIIQKATSK